MLKSSTNNILLSNLINIRWIAISGQLVAILLVYYYFNINIPIILCLLVSLISTIVNIFSYFTQKTNNYLSDNEAFYFLLFDTIQLAALLFLTGGIYNPFCLLLIAPLIISASYLRIVFSLILSSLSIFLVIFLSIYYIQIEWRENFIVPDLFSIGLALSLITSLIFIAVYVYTFARSSRKLSEALDETQNALTNQKKISEIGSLSAAAVHELSTPLNTIFLILGDLLKDGFINKNNKIVDEIKLMHTQVDRCKSILFRLSKNPQKLKDDFINKTTISNIIKINFDEYNMNNLKLNIVIDSQENEPQIIFQDEIMFAISNIIQNATQYAKTLIKAKISWTKKEFIIAIIDDGNGFSKEILDKIGNPYISSKEKLGMGLGIFIAKNLIENINGRIIFRNNLNQKGSCVEIKINRDKE